MKIKDLGYALIGVIFATKQDKINVEEANIEFEETFKESMISAFRSREQARAMAQENFRNRGESLKRIECLQEFHQDHRCNHKKGGNALKGIVEGKGDSNQFSVIKHRHRNGDIHVHCLRCSKRWVPGDEDYIEAKAFPTLNTTSTDVLVASVTASGQVTNDYAEAQRKWMGVRQYDGIGFWPFGLKHENQNIQQMVDKIIAQQVEKELPSIVKPVTFKKELVEIVGVTTVRSLDLVDNPKFNVVNGGPSSVS